MSCGPSVVRALAAAVASVAAALLAAGCGGKAEVEFQPSRAPVRYEVARRGPHQASLALLGTVRPSSTAQLSSSLGGRIAYPARFASGLRTGEQVAAGETLAVFENEVARLRLTEARLVSESAATDLDRLRRSLDAGIIEEEKYAAAENKARLARERLESAERDARRLTLPAPASGRLIVTRVYSPGTEVAAGTVIAELAAGGPPCVEASASAVDLKSLRVGLRALFMLPGGVAPAGEGAVREVASVIDATGTARVVIEVTSSRGLPAPGEGVDVRVELEKRPNVLSVPEAALVIGESGGAVYVVERGAMGGSVAKRVSVRSGGRGGGRVEILQGISEGDQVIVSGAALLSDGQAVAESPEETAAGPAATGAGR